MKQTLDHLLGKHPLLREIEGVTAEEEANLVEFRDYKGTLRMVCTPGVYKEILLGKWKGCHEG